ncbi:MAG: permease-like cell division protein FtsX [Blautia faecicola]|nr:permease-like cell division protein FtsX [Ruminococcus sp.]MBT9845793.1 FtsX-like permease family protein [Blautia sp. MCC289]MCB8597260.1 permease-like cell division protein FtsX [Blautia sp. DFI.9.9]MCC2237152.1 permease-like cell division protein FtsX [Fusicatenibacter sp. CLA-AA-H213]MCC2775244.1 permease-like cell division protein FtsX [Blautia sp. DFI.4.84]MCG5645475.1 permease-like cell division protein FtsX [Oliverpabstia sp. DFI.9.49]MEE0013648.1 permease-like cell division protei
MRISTIGYSAKQGIKNIWRNIMFSAASIATMTACIFLFGLFFSLLINFRYIVKNAEEGVAVTVLFDDGVDQATINSIGEQIKAYKGVTKVEYVSAEEAWDEWSKQYFGDTELESEMAEGFKNDNPLANSSSYSVYVDKIEHQDALVKYIEGLDGVREVNQLKGATQTLSSFNTLLTYISVAIILILLCVAVFLISNTVAIGISIRKEEIGIMKLIGATNFFVRAPFLIEGMIIGLIGAIIPLVLLFVMYKKVIEYVLTKFSMLSSVVQFMSVTQVFEVLTPVALILGMGIGLFGSVITIRKHLRV